MIAMGRCLVRTRFAVLAVAVASSATIVGCTGGVADFPITPEGSGEYSRTTTSDGPRETIFGSGKGINLGNVFGSGGKNADGNAGGGIGVNGFLWRATLDTVSFMPLSSADPFGGVIITDWYALPEAPSERFKLNIYILGRQLRADGLRVAVFRQAQAGDGNWINASVKTDTSIRLEDQILTRARQLRVAATKFN